MKKYLRIIKKSTFAMTMIIIALGLSLTAFIVGVVLGYTSGLKEKIPVPDPNTIVYQVPREVVGLATKLGLTYQDMVVTHTQIGAGQDVGTCDPKFFTACYNSADHSIRIYVSTFTNPGEDPTTTLAYEFSHYKWQIMPQTEKDSVTPLMNAFYTANKTRIDSSQKDLIRLEGGFGTPIFEDELHSIVCTKVADSELAPALLAHCSSYLPNRSVLRNIF